MGEKLLRAQRHPRCGPALFNVLGRDKPLAIHTALHDQFSPLTAVGERRGVLGECFSKLINNRHINSGGFTSIMKLHASLHFYCLLK